MDTASRTALAVLAAAAFPLLAVSGTKPPATTRVSLSSAGGQGNYGCLWPSISASGRFVAFQSNSEDLVPGDTNGNNDIFVKDRTTGLLTRVSVDSDGKQVAAGGGYPRISASGRLVAFESTATTLVPGDANGVNDVFVHDMRTGTTTRVSVDSDGGEANGDSGQSALSANGRFVTFISSATNLVPGDTNGQYDLFVHDLRTGATVRANLDSYGNQTTGSPGYPAISANGRFVAFNAGDGDLVPGDANGMTDIFVRDMKAGLTTRVSVATNGQEANSQCFEPSISASGRLVAFTSDATSLVPANFGTFFQVFLHDTKSGTTGRVSGFTADVGGNERSTSPSIAANGRFVAFTSYATNLVAGDTNGQFDVYVHDVKAGTLVRGSVDSLGVEADDYSDGPSLSANGRFVAFFSRAANLAPGDTNGGSDIFVRDLK